MSELPDEQTQEQAPDEQVEGVPAEPPTPIQPPDEEDAGEEELIEGEPDAPDAPEQPEGLSEKQLEKALTKLDSEANRHTKRVHEIMGNEAEVLVPCPLCEPMIPGYVMPTPATPERFPAVRQFMGDAQPRKLKPDPDASQCEACGGEGMVDTGSHVQGQDALPCKRCDGFGWTGPRRQSVPMAPARVADLAGGNGESQPVPQGPEPPEAAKLRALGYTLIQPVGA